MGRVTRIGWADGTVNFWRGCKKKSPGCAHCYMFDGQTRWGHDPSVVTRTSEATFHAALRWLDPMRIFTCSWSDFFIAEADQWRDDAWDVIRRTPWHTWMILTKEPERIASHLPADWGGGWPHVWLGVSVENQRFVHRAEMLAGIPAKVRFVSAEPLLGPVDLDDVLWPGASFIFGEPVPNLAIQWVIVGGESGPRARRMDPSWARALVEQCRSRGVRVFVKQTGAVLAREWGLRDRKGEDPGEWPEELQVQEFPARRLA